MTLINGSWYINFIIGVARKIGWHCYYMYMYICIILCTGIRLYFTTTPDGVVARPSLLALVHARLPPGYTPTNRISPSTRVHQAYYRKGATC